MFLLSLFSAFVPAEDSLWPQKPSWPPVLPGGMSMVSVTSRTFLQAPTSILPEIAVARKPPTVDFMYYPGQEQDDFWSNWGDGTAVGGKYYSTIGNHKGTNGQSFVYEYDSSRKTLRQLLDVARFLDLPEGHYVPGKIHGRIDLGRDGWLYMATARGSTKVTSERYHFGGDWIIRVHPLTSMAEVIVRGAPIPEDTILAAVTDPERLIFYGGTAAADPKDKRVRFFAYDLKSRSLLYSGYDGPARYMILSQSTGKVYFTGTESGALYRYDPVLKGGAPVKMEGEIGIRAASRETPAGLVYTVSNGQGKEAPLLWSFDVKTEAITRLDDARVGTQTYITSLDADPSGRYLYYVPGAHGGSDKDGSPVVQYDTQTRRKKVIAFLHPFFRDRYGFVPMGTFSTAVDSDGSKVYVSWSGNRLGVRSGKMSFDTCGLAVIHIPESERE